MTAIGKPRTPITRPVRLPPLLRLWAILLILLCAPVFGSAGDLEYHVKAAYLYKFAGYVEWPEAASRTDQPFAIGVIGGRTMADELRRLLVGRSIGGRSAQVHEIKDAERLPELQLLFIGRSADVALARKLRNQNNSRTLIVTEAPGALDQGSMINFVLVDRRVRFEVDQPAAERAGLKVSGQLLSAALAVHKEPDP